MGSCRTTRKTMSRDIGKREPLYAAVEEGRRWAREEGGPDIYEKERRKGVKNHFSTITNENASWYNT